MIQDINPEVYDNSFEHRRAPQSDDPVLLYMDGGFLAHREENGIRYPAVSEVIAAVTAQSPAHAPDPHHDEQTEIRGHRETERGDRYFISGIEFIFLFRIDESAYFGIDEEAVIELKDGDFCAPEYKLKSRPKIGEAPLSIDYLDELPA